ncbi:MAG: EAL domain-containing protein [Candidatus Hodarchaeota archaeon]
MHPNIPLPANEEQRLVALKNYLFLDILSDAVFERLTNVVARLFGMPMSAISVVDADAQRLRARYGLDLQEISRDVSFCTHTVLADAVTVVHDTSQDPRFQQNPLVIGPPHVRFYAGVPLRTPEGFAFGTLCIMDRIPRHLNGEQTAALCDLAGMVMGELDVRVSMAKTLAAEDERRMGDEQYRELFENANDIVYTHDLQGNFTSINKAAQRITGYEREEALQFNILQMMEPDSRELTRQMIQQNLGGSAQTTYEVTMVTKDNRRVMLEVSTRLLFRKGIPIGVQGIARDITERKRAEAQLRLLKSVVVNANDGVVVAEAGEGDPLESKIVYINEAFTRMTGYTDVELSGKTMRILHGPNTNEKQLGEIRAAIQSWEPTRAELIHYRKDGAEFWVDVNVVPIVDERGASNFWVSVLRETTDRKRAEILEQDRNEVLELVARNEPLETVLTQLARLVERQCPNLVCTLLLVRDGRLCHVASPSLPQSYADVFDGLEAAPTGGPCGAACWGKPVIVTDVSSEPALADQCGLLQSLNLRACWSVPILSGEGVVLGVFALYFRERRKPLPGESELLEMASRLAAVAIEQRQLHDQLAHQARHDALTGLPNRLMFGERLQHALTEARRNDWLLAVLFIDLDRFKQINDTLGHTVGDSLLQQVSRRLESCLRKSDSLARMGGDEFTLVLSELKDPQDALRVAQKLLNALEAPFSVGAYELFVTASIGISVYPRDGRDAATLQRSADSAMYRAKTRGKNSYEFFTPDLSVAALEQLEIETALRRAMENNELQLYYQPQVEMSGKLAGLEALLVWNHPKLGVISPTQFIPVAEESGMIVPIGAWVLEEACRQNAVWRAVGYRTVTVAVNVSPMQFARADFVETVASALRHSGLESSLLELELTESVVMRDVVESARQMERLRTLGVSISIDDFGTGYSSLSYLRRLPIDNLKIDQSFLEELEKDSNTMPLVQAIVALAHGLGLSVIAEGVETEAQMEVLRAVKCDKVQGYLLGGPLPAEAAERLLQHPQVVRD